MATQRFTKTVQPSLFDRLIDLEPHNRAEAPVNRAESLRQFRMSVKRDLEWLMNTTCAPIELPEPCENLKQSLLFYGLPDITSIALHEPGDEQKLLRAIETAIETFEPRLANARVIGREAYRPAQQAITFHIEAILLVDPAPERISFDTVLEIAKGAYSVKEA